MEDVRIILSGLWGRPDADLRAVWAAPPPRHVAIWVDAAAVAATIEITERGLENDPVELPSHVDVAWALCGEADPCRAAVRRVDNDLTWTVLSEFFFGQ